MDPNANSNAFRPSCSLCKTPRASMGTGIPDRQKRSKYVNYRWCVRCDRA